MRTLNFTVTQEWVGVTLKVFLRSYCQLSARLLTKQKRIPMGLTINGEHGKANDLLKAGDLVCVNLPACQPHIEPVELPLSIMYEDVDLLVIEKAYAMPVYPTAGHDRDSLANALQYYYKTQGLQLGFYPVYRLDKDTSGLMVIAKHGYAAARLSKAITKEYTAVCEGVLTGQGTICAPIALKPGYTIQREVVPGGQFAVTHWRAIAQTNRYTLLRISLETGRTHQIRVHFAHLGYPLAGDDMYGGSLTDISRQALCCSKVQFAHPVMGKAMEFTAALPGDIQALMQL